MRETYVYRHAGVQRAVIATALAGVSMSLGLVVLFSFDQNRKNLLGAIPPQMQLWVLLFLLVAVALISALLLWRLVRHPAIDGEIVLKQGVLRFDVKRGNRTVRIEAEARKLTLKEHDDESMHIATPQGEFVFRAAGFSSMEEYDEFRMALICAHHNQ